MLKPGRRNPKTPFLSSALPAYNPSIHASWHTIVKKPDIASSSGNRSDAALGTRRRLLPGCAVQGRHSRIMAPGRLRLKRHTEISWHDTGAASSISSTGLPSAVPTITPLSAAAGSSSCRPVIMNWATPLLKRAGTKATRQKACVPSSHGSETPAIRDASSPPRRQPTMPRCRCSKITGLHERNLRPTPTS